jgi:hypothetical protein
LTVKVLNIAKKKESGIEEGVFIIRIMILLNNKKLWIACSKQVIKVQSPMKGCKILEKNI